MSAHHQHREALAAGRSRCGRITSSAAVRQNEAEDNMALTKSFKDLVQRHIAEDPAHGEAPLRGDPYRARWRRRHRQSCCAANQATISFEKQGEAANSLKFGPRG
jgi:hypothetical protein